MSKEKSDGSNGKRGNQLGNNNQRVVIENESLGKRGGRGKTKGRSRRKPDNNNNQKVVIQDELAKKCGGEER